MSCAIFGLSKFQGCGRCLVGIFIPDRRQDKNGILRICVFEFQGRLSRRFVSIQRLPLPLTLTAGRGRAGPGVSSTRVRPCVRRKGRLMLTVFCMARDRAWARVRDRVSLRVTGMITWLKIECRVRVRVRVGFRTLVCCLYAQYHFILI